MNIGNFKIGTRLTTGFLIVLLLLAVVAGLGLNGIATIQKDLENITGGNDVKVNLAGKMRDQIFEQMISVSNTILLTNDAEIKTESKRIKEYLGQYAEAEAKLDKKFSENPDTTTVEKDLMVKIKSENAVVAPLIANVLELANTNKDEDATKVLNNDLHQVQRRWLNSLTELIAFEKKQDKEAIAHSRLSYTNAHNWMLIISGFSITLGALLAWLISRSITGPINDAVKVAQTVALGDLTSHIKIKSSDEIGQLLQALKDMNDGLVRIVGEVRGGTDMIATASGQIASGNLDLSSRTEEQASSLEETAASMEELTGTVKQNADNARQANGLAASASEVAVKGGRVVSQVVDTMSSINASSKKIVDIISVIDGIAFQTNILALNAAVEAARAGEQGRGFAVVASEVRNLAQRSAAAAKEIKTLISDSVEKVDAGTQLVDQAGTTMQEIVDSIRHVTDIMSEITAASQEQSSGIDQINQAIMQMDDVTQQNAALVEEAAAAAQAMEDQAGKLVEVVSVFKLDGMHTAVTTPAKAVRRAMPVVKKAVVPITATTRNAKRPAMEVKRVTNEPATTDKDWEEF
jgi:methyl-accepting chemotaxis protein